MYLAVAMSIGKYFRDVRDAMTVAVSGIKAVLPAILILAMAYCINTISKTLGAQQYIISVTEAWMTSSMLPAITFITGSLISFFTGTAWGTYAIITPFVMPIAMNFSGGSPTLMVLATVGAIVGGGVFGDHCSPQCPILPVCPLLGLVQIILTMFLHSCLMPLCVVFWPLLYSLLFVYWLFD